MSSDFASGTCPARYDPRVFVFFSNRLGCLGSIAVSLVGTVVLVLLMYSCSAGLS